MRDPSIHITESELRAIVERAFLTPEGKAVLQFDSKAFTEQILTQAKNKSVLNRSILPTNQKTEKTLTTKLLSTDQQALAFTKVLAIMRKQAKHRGVKQITPRDTREWPYIKNIAKNVYEFSKDFNLEYTEACQEYITTGIGLMKNYSLSKMISLDEKIFRVYEAVAELKHDKRPDITRQVYELYNELIMDRTGIPNDYDKQPEKYVYFFRVKQACIKYNVTADHYLKSQFEFYDKMNSYPDPVQLVGEKPIQALNQYLFKRNIKLKKRNGTKHSNTKQ